MNQQAVSEQIDRLVHSGASEPGSRGFAALAEAQRRAGRPEEALRIAEEGLRAQPDLIAGRVALGLALIDLDRLDEARSELARVLDTVPDHPLALGAVEELEPDEAERTGNEAAAPPFSELAEVELECALQEAEAERDQMMDANQVAAQTLRALEDGAPEGAIAATRDSPFATDTVAALLERQGHGEEAQVLRHAIEQRDAGPAGDSLTAHDRARVIKTLERWLDNLRREPR